MKKLSPEKALVEQLARERGWRPMNLPTVTPRAWLLTVAAELDTVIAAAPGHPGNERCASEAATLREASAAAVATPAAYFAAENGATNA